jgi:hypothetical protein
MVAGAAHARQHVAQFGIVVEQFEQCLAAGATRADAEYVFRRGIEGQYQAILIKQDDARTEAIENGLCRLSGAAVTLTTGAGPRFVRT